jgi:hypothetical protein
MEQREFLEWAYNEENRNKRELKKEIIFQTKNIAITSPEEFYLALERYNELLENESDNIKSAEILALEKAIEDYWPIMYPNDLLGNGYLAL